MHHACKLLIRVTESNGIATVPRSRPPGRITLYALRTTVLILSAECTVTIRSEYISTASVLSSCAGIGALVSACIHAGASPPDARAGSPKATAATNSNQQTPALSSIARPRSHRLQDDLFFIARPHELVEIPQCRIILRVNHQQIAA